MLISEKISVVVPCYKDEPNVRELLRRLTATLNEISTEWEILYINDASPDNAWEVIKDEASREKRIIAVNLSRNFGVMSVFRVGLEMATGDAVVIMDGDLQDPPEVIPQFVEKWKQGYFVVYGVREKRDETLFRRVSYRVFYHIWKTCADIDIPLNAGEFALVDKTIAKIICAMPERNLFLRGIRSWVGFPQTGVGYHRPDRFAGVTTQTFLSYINWSFKAISSFSVKPLRFISTMACVASLLMVILFIVNVFLYLSNIQAPKGFFTTLFVMLFGFSSILIALAIISEYIIHIFYEVKKRPHYLVKDVVNKETSNQ